MASWLYLKGQDDKINKLKSLMSLKPNTNFIKVKLRINLTALIK